MLVRLGQTIRVSRAVSVRSLSAQVDKNKLSYTEKQDKTGRPVSPHVTIYKFPVTALSSITNRVTGVALTAGITGIGIVSLLNGDAPLLMQAIGSSAIGPLAKIAVSFPLIYHYLGGVRHIVWDKQPETHINNESVEKSSYILFGAAGALSLITAVL